jgi:hypothetical protein
MGPRKDKRPVQTVWGGPGKTPVLPRTLPSADTSRRRPSWRFGMVDNDGPWPLTACAGGELHEVLERLRSFETMTCNALEQSQMLKHYAIEEMPTRAATDRLRELHLDDMTRLSNFRIGGEPRLHGFMDEDSTFHVLWWDPRHEVWPSKLKHT